MIAQWLPKNSRRRTTTASIALVLVVMAFSKFVLPNGAPLGVIVHGFVGSTQTALLAAGFILVYRNTRIINFSQGILGAVAASLAFQLAAVGILQVGRVPFPIPIIVALILATGIGMVIELAFVRRFFNSPRLVLTVVTVVLAPVLSPLPGYINGLPFWNNGPSIQRIRLDGKMPLPFNGFKLSLFPFVFGFADVFAVVGTVAVFAGLGWFMTRSTLGAAVRGTAENADRALMLGINVRLLSTIVWGIAAFCSGLAALNVGMTSRFGAASALSPDALLTPLAAAVLGRMRSLPVAITAAFTMGILQASLNWSFAANATAFNIVVLLVILVGLFVQRTGFSRIVEGAAGSWAATKEIRPTPRELLELPGIRRLRRGLFAVIAIIVVVFPQAVAPARANLASLIAIYAIIALSLVILTGWGGQVSLGQFALVAVGAVVGGKLTGDLHISFWVALPIAAGFTAGFATLVGQPALRLRGPFLAVSTLAFAALVSTVLLDDARFGFLIPSSVERPRLLFISFANERAYYYLCLIFAVLAAIVVRRLRAGRPGRVLIALREDEFGVQPFGINANRARLAVFALSGAFAGVAGILLVHHQRDLNPMAFGVDQSVDMFIMAMVGGVTSVSGALLGATYIGLTRFFINDEQIRRLSTSLGLLYLLFATPGGLSAALYSTRDSLLRIVATRRRLVVPSLFEDADPEALRRSKASFAPPLDGRGLASSIMTRRYSLPSVLYRSDKASADAVAAPSQEQT